MSEHNHETFRALVMERSKKSISATNVRSMAFSVSSITQFNKVFSITDEEESLFIKSWEDAGRESDDPQIKFIVAMGCKALKEKRSLDELGYLGSGN
jgi:hypothetical protein